MIDEEEDEDENGLRRSTVHEELKEKEDALKYVEEELLDMRKIFLAKEEAFENAREEWAVRCDVMRSDASSEAAKLSSDLTRLRSDVTLLREENLIAKRDAEQAKSETEVQSAEVREAQLEVRRLKTALDSVNLALHTAAHPSL